MSKIMAIAATSIQSPRQIARLLIIIGTGLGLLTEQPALAHPQMTRSVRHRAAITAGPKNVDVTIELTLGEVPALLERLAMDADGDNQISPDEIEFYLNEHSEVLQEAVNLSIADQPLELLFLYEPEIDLRGEDTSSAFRLVFRLFFFARTPHGLSVGDELALSDRLWSHAPAMATFQVTGQGGIELAAESSTGERLTLPGNEKSLEMRARYLTVPTVPQRVGGGLPAQSALTTITPAAEKKSPAGRGPLLTWTIIIGAMVLVACTTSALARNQTTPHYPET
ncbi:MAG: hypothetical protein ACR2NM_13050 [Bythopirellula sp.]